MQPLLFHLATPRRPELNPRSFLAPHAPVATCPQLSYRLSWAVALVCAAGERSAGHGESVPAGLPGRCASDARGHALAGPALLVPGGRRSARPAAPGAGTWPPPAVPSAPRGGSPVGQQLRKRMLMVYPRLQVQSLVTRPGGTIRFKDSAQPDGLIFICNLHNLCHSNRKERHCS